MLTTFVIALLALYGLLCLALYLLQERLIFHPERLPPDYQFRFPGTVEELSLEVDGGTVSALHFRAARARGAVLYFHGNAGSLRQWGTLADDFVRRGYDLLIVDYRGFGKSAGGLRHERHLLADALVAYRYLEGHYVEQQIVLYGRSLGSGVAAYLAATRRPRALILETPYLSLRDLALRQFRFVPPFLLKYPLRTDRWIAQVECPVYLIHGTHDALIPYSSSEQLLPLIRAPHRLITIPGGGHNNLAAAPLYHAALDEALGGEVGGRGEGQTTSGTAPTRGLER